MPLISDHHAASNTACTVTVMTEVTDGKPYQIGTRFVVNGVTCEVLTSQFSSVRDYHLRVAALRETWNIPPAI